MASSINWPGGMHYMAQVAHVSAICQAKRRVVVGVLNNVYAMTALPKDRGK